MVILVGFLIFFFVQLRDPRKFINSTSTHLFYLLFQISYYYFDAKEALHLIVEAGRIDSVLQPHIIDFGDFWFNRELSHPFSLVGTKISGK